MLVDKIKAIFTAVHFIKSCYSAIASSYLVAAEESTWPIGG